MHFLIVAAMAASVVHALPPHFTKANYTQDFEEFNSDSSTDDHVPGPAYALNWEKIYQQFVTITGGTYPGFQEADEFFYGQTDESGQFGISTSYNHSHVFAFNLYSFLAGCQSTFTVTSGAAQGEAIPLGVDCDIKLTGYAAIGRKPVVTARYSYSPDIQTSPNGLPYWQINSYTLPSSFSAKNLARVAFQVTYPPGFKTTNTSYTDSDGNNYPGNYGALLGNFDDIKYQVLNYTKH